MSEVLNQVSPQAEIDQLVADKVRTQTASRRAKATYERCRSEEKAVDERFAQATADPAWRAYANKQLKAALNR